MRRDSYHNIDCPDDTRLIVGTAVKGEELHITVHLPLVEDRQQPGRVLTGYVMMARTDEQREQDGFTVQLPVMTDKQAKAATALTEARGSVAEVVNLNADVLRSIRGDARWNGEDETREALDDILNALDAWSKASNAFVASLATR